MQHFIKIKWDCVFKIVHVGNTLLLSVIDDDNYNPYSIDIKGTLKDTIDKFVQTQAGLDAEYTFIKEWQHS